MLFKYTRFQTYFNFFLEILEKVLSHSKVDYLTFLLTCWTFDLCLKMLKLISLFYPTVVSRLFQIFTLKKKKKRNAYIFFLLHLIQLTNDTTAEYQRTIFRECDRRKEFCPLRSAFTAWLRCPFCCHLVIYPFRVYAYTRSAKCLAVIKCSTHIT